MARGPGRTVLKTIQCELSVVELFKPDIALLQLGANDLIHLSPVNVGSAIEDLTCPFMIRLTSNVHVSAKLFTELGLLPLTRR